MAVDLISFRTAVPRDARAIAAIHEAVWCSTYQGIIPHLHLKRMIPRRGALWWQQQIERGANVTLLIFDGLPQGYATWGEARGTWPWPAGEIFELYLMPTYQGVGLGSRLFSTVKKALKHQGLDHLVVWALKDNENACAFYGGLGGSVTAAAPERYGEVSLTRIAFVWGVNVKSSKA
jgi:ribosomal protein S18 acetylase RimI-like enzyme